MPDLDGGHYFFTAVVPICNAGIVEHEGMKSSPVHMVREALETLPTALQSPVTERVGIQSPFARSLRTHFARFVVLDQPYFNGRNHEDALAAAITGVDLLSAEPDDALSCPYLLVMIDFDPVRFDGRGEPRSYFEELWTLMPDELTAVFRYCYGFPAVKDARSFADFILPCQVETTMPFNDYWVGAPPLASMSTAALVAIPAGGLFIALVAAACGVWSWQEGLLAGLLLAVVGLAIDYLWIMARGRKPFPANPDATLRHVLKGLYLQQAFTRFAAQQQGRGPEERGAAFRTFLERCQPANLDGPTQQPGVIRSLFPKVDA